jgi:hypothetical protein
MDHELGLESNMPSKAYQTWRTIRRAELDRIEHAHTAVGVTGRGRWYATQQVNQAYVGDCSIITGLETVPVLAPKIRTYV